MSDQIIMSLHLRPHGQEIIVNFDHVITIEDELAASRHGSGKEPVVPHKFVGGLVTTIAGAFPTQETVADVTEHMHQLFAQRELAERQRASEDV